VGYFNITYGFDAVFNIAREREEVSVPTKTFMIEGVAVVIITRAMVRAKRYINLWGKGDRRKN
jgi:hypothetical protein